MLEAQVVDAADSMTYDAHDTDDALKPEFVMPLVLKLCDENSKETGGLYEVGAGWIGKVRWERTQGHAFDVGEGFTPEDVNDVWDKIVDFTDADHPASIAEANRPVIKNLKGGA